jgi:hypothetical protein
MPKGEKYDSIIREIFFKHYQNGSDSFEFDRSEIEAIAHQLDVELPKNLGDLIYSFRFRKEFPSEILQTEPDGMDWRIELAGRSKYRFRLGRTNRIIPQENLLTIKLPNALPAMVEKHALTDEQALLAIVRYNRLIDIFLGITTYLLQSHLRTTVANIGQIEIDELYVGLNGDGVQFVIPVQAKVGSDQIGGVQTQQDIKCCEEKFPELIPRPIATQFMPDGIIAMFELGLDDDLEVKVINEKHYKLVQAGEVSERELKLYSH